jgi:hypothetical protein
LESEVITLDRTTSDWLILQLSLARSSIDGSAVWIGSDVSCRSEPARSTKYNIALVFMFMFFLGLGISFWELGLAFWGGFVSISEFWSLDNPRVSILIVKTPWDREERSLSLVSAVLRRRAPFSNRDRTSSLFLTIFSDRPSM